MSNCRIINNFISKDKRGYFYKIFNFKKLSKFNIKEIYLTSSKKNCFRGFHFQIPPMEGDKIVTCISGKVVDYVIDLRKKKKSYGKVSTYELSSADKSLFIPKGFAHGFLSMTNKTEMLYVTNNLYSRKHDKGISYKDIKFELKKIKKLKISNRDKKFPKITSFKSPF